MTKKAFIPINVLFLTLISIAFLPGCSKNIETPKTIDASQTIIEKIPEASEPQTKTYKTTDEIPKMDAALVLGAAAYPNRLSAILEDRVLTAIELYQAGKVDKIIMSGGENEAPAMKEYAVEHGIPAEVIQEDPNGLNTFASFKNLGQTESKITIVSQAYHLPRALLIAEGLGVEAIGLEADKREYANMEEYKDREVLATGKAILDLMQEK